MTLPCRKRSQGLTERLRIWEIWLKSLVIRTQVHFSQETAPGRQSKVCLLQLYRLPEPSSQCCLPRCIHQIFAISADVPQLHWSFSATNASWAWWTWTLRFPLETSLPHHMFRSIQLSVSSTITFCSMDTCLENERPEQRVDLCTCSVWCLYQPGRRLRKVL
jgi:hypothetical protein